MHKQPKPPTERMRQAIEAGKRPWRAEDSPSVLRERELFDRRDGASNLWDGEALADHWGEKVPQRPWQKKTSKRKGKVQNHAPRVEARRIDRRAERKRARLWAASFR